MEKLVKKAKKGDAEAFIALMEQNRQSMIRIAFAYLGNEEDVADAMQETILSAFEKLCKFVFVAVFRISKKKPSPFGKAKKQRPKVFFQAQKGVLHTLRASRVKAVSRA